MKNSIFSFSCIIWILPFLGVGKYPVFPGEVGLPPPWANVVGHFQAYEIPDQLPATRGCPEDFHRCPRGPHLGLTMMDGGGVSWDWPAGAFAALLFFQ